MRFLAISTGPRYASRVEAQRGVATWPVPLFNGAHMVGKLLRGALAAAALLCIPLFTAASYPTITMSNRSNMKLNIVVSYALPLICEPDFFSVSAGGTGTATEGRGVCLVTKITATGGSSPVSSYTSSGTSYGAFVVAQFGNTFQIVAAASLPQ